MTPRERFLATVLFREVDRPPFVELFGPWEATLIRWEKEGLGEDKYWATAFDFDHLFWTTVPIDMGYFPLFEEEILEDLGDNIIVRDKRGVIKKRKKGGTSMPQFLEYPVKNKKDWEKIKGERLDPDTPDRFPTNWDLLIKEYKSRDYPLFIGGFPYGLFGTPRDLMGVEKLLVTYYDDPELIEDMVSYLTDFWLRIYTKILDNIKVDGIHIWEDMASRNGSLISPTMFRKFMSPCYRKISNFMKRNDIPVLSVDTDGNCSELVPLFLEVGVNLVWPFEVQAGNDILEYRRKYPNLGIMGGLDKRAMAKGKKEIDQELDKAKRMLKFGGYIAAPDHCIPPDVSWDNCKYFFSQLKKIIGREIGVNQRF